MTYPFGPPPMKKAGKRMNKGATWVKRVAASEPIIPARQCR